MSTGQSFFPPVARTESVSQPHRFTIVSTARHIRRASQSNQIIISAFLMPTARQPKPTRTENIGSVA
jgi:alanine dehydrogenase